MSAKKTPIQETGPGLEKVDTMPDSGLPADSLHLPGSAFGRVLEQLQGSAFMYSARDLLLLLRTLRGAMAALQPTDPGVLRAFRAELEAGLASIKSDQLAMKF